MKTELVLLIIVLGQIESMRLFKRIKRQKGDDDDTCNLKLGQKCELFEGGRHNCMKQSGLTCALFCEKDKVGDCQYWCVLKVGQTCSENSQCLYEYCDENKICSKRKETGEKCEKNEECFSFKCKQNSCAEVEDPNKKCNEKGNDIIEPDPIDPEPPIIEDQYDSLNGKQIDTDPNFKLDLTDNDGYFNEKKGELLAPCKTYNDCIDGQTAVDGSGTSSLACQQGKCRLKPGEFCYPGNNHQDYVCYNKNKCQKRYVLRKFKKDQDLKIYDTIMEMTDKEQQKQLNQWNQKISRIQSLGEFDFLNSRIPMNRDAFYITYQCAVRRRYQCTDNKFCGNYNCLPLDGNPDGKEKKKMCVDVTQDNACEQSFQCYSKNCFKNDMRQTCQDRKNDKEPCNYSFECQSHNCRRYKPTAFVQQIKLLLEKECQPAGSLPLNAECQVTGQCSDSQVENDGTTKKIGKLECLESNIVNNDKDKARSIQLIQFFYDNHNKGKDSDDEKNEQLAGNDEDLNNNDLEKTIDANFLFKCKIPKGQACTENSQCGYNSICHDGVCKGDENAFCKNKDDCKSGMLCYHNSDVESPYYRRKICSSQPAVNQQVGDDVQNA